MLGFLTYLNKNKYDWTSLDYARVGLKYNVKDIVKLLQKLAAVKEMRIQNCIKRPRWSFGENV